MVIAVVINVVINRVVVLAIKNVSDSTPSPKLAAIKVSRINPRNLLPRVKIIIINAYLAVLFLLVISWPSLFSTIFLIIILFQYRHNLKPYQYIHQIMVHS